MPLCIITQPMECERRCQIILIVCCQKFISDVDIRWYPSCRASCCFIASTKIHTGLCRECLVVCVHCGALCHVGHCWDWEYRRDTQISVLNQWVFSSDQCFFWCLLEYNLNIRLSISSSFGSVVVLFPSLVEEHSGNVSENKKINPNL